MGAKGLAGPAGAGAAHGHAELAAISETGDAYCCRCRDDRGWLQRGLSEDASVSEARLTGVSQLGSSCGGSACVGVALAHLPSPNTPRRVEGRFMSRVHVSVLLVRENY